jgi:phage tail protein X
MGRYDNSIYSLPIKLDTENKRRYYDSLIDPIIPRTINDIYIITVIGDRLDLLAWKYYSDVTLWWAIAAANPELRKDSLFLEPGIQLRIPPGPDTLLNQLQNLNETR